MAKDKCERVVQMVGVVFIVLVVLFFVLQFVGVKDILHYMLTAMLAIGLTMYFASGKVLG